VLERIPSRLQGISRGVHLRQARYHQEGAACRQWRHPLIVQYLNKFHRICGRYQEVLVRQGMIQWGIIKYILKIVVMNQMELWTDMIGLKVPNVGNQCGMFR
jgi:hypothetical protein